ncbi:MAG TPA: hypothetical protein DEG23_01820 [Coxiellaceae bacterium]|nr:hypothetical protein [Coxiellaceae bacterium]
MNNVTNETILDVINLLDIWKKIAQYKKVFWSIFFVIFIIGVLIVFSIPEKYNFSMVIEIGRSPDEMGRNVLDINDNSNRKIDSSGDSYGTKIRKVFYPKAVRAYNLQAVKKVYENDIQLAVENAGSGTVLMSINGPLKNSDEYKFILHEIVAYFADDTKAYIDYRVKTLNTLKENLERRLVEVSDFYKSMLSYGLVVGKKKSKDNVNLESRVLSMYLNDQNLIMTQLANNISTLQAQIFGTYNTRIISDVVVSDKPVGPPKYLLLVLVIMASFFFAFFGVFLGAFVVNLKNRQE